MSQERMFQSWEVDLQLLLTWVIRCSRRMLVCCNRGKTTGLNEFLLAEAFLAMRMHIGGTWVHGMGGGRVERGNIAMRPHSRTRSACAGKATKHEK